MKTVAWAALVAAALALGCLRLTAAEARFRHLASIYFDEKGVGLNLPEGVACDDKGHVIVGDTGNDRLLTFTYEDKATKGGAEIKVPELSAPTRVQLASKGEILALDGKRRRLVRLSADGAFKGEVAFEGVPPPATVIPKSFRIDGADNLYVLDVFSARVLVLDTGGRFQKALAFPADAGFVTDLAVDTTGTMLLLDSTKRRVYAAGKDATSFAPLGKALTESLSTMPTFITTSRGTIFIAEGNGSAIVTLGQDGTFLARQLAKGGSDGMLNYPSQFCINDNDEVFVADRDNSRVQVFALGR